MPLRPIAVSAVIFIFLIIAIYEIYVKLHGAHFAAQISTNAQWIGIIDMEADHGVDLLGILEGHDALLMIDSTNPLLQQIIKNRQAKEPLLAISNIEIADYDENKDGLLDILDPIYPFLQVITFNPDGQGYTIKTLHEAGIRGIKIQHLNAYGNHYVIMSDGTYRTLYEINRLGGTTIYRNGNTKTITIFPETQPSI